MVYRVGYLVFMVHGEEGRLTDIQERENEEFGQMEAGPTGADLLDGKTGLVPGLVPGFQDWKCPGTLTQTWH